MKDTNEVMEFFVNLHDIKCNQKYNGDLPYSFHLKAVFAQYRRFGHLLSQDKRTFIVQGIWGHDSIEDARMTYNDLKFMFNKEMAEIIYLCTEMRGRTRKERKSDEFYKELFTNKEALFVKLCDIIANTTFSMLTNSSMFEKYKEEYPHFKELCYWEPYNEMFNYLENLFEIN